MNAKKTIGGVLGLFLLVGLAVLFVSLNQRPVAETEVQAKSDEVPVLLSGTVLNIWNEPIPGASIQLGTQHAALSATSDASGRFEFLKTNNDYAGPATLRADHPDYVVPGPGDIGTMKLTLTDAPMTNVRLTMRKPGTISGRVVAGRRPVQARIGLSYTQTEGLGGPTGPYSLDAVTSSDAQGRFQISGAAPGQLRVFVSSDAFAYTESRNYALEDGEALTNIVVDVSPGTHVMGNVLNTDGNPIQNATIIATGSALQRPRRVVSNAAGKFEVEQVPLGTMDLQVTAQGYGSERVSVEVEAAMSAVDVVLSIATGYYGIVVNEQGNPVSPAWLYGLPKIAANHQLGTFDVPLEAVAGPVDVTFITPFHPPHTQRLEPGVEAQVTLPAGGMISGTVQDSSGLPVQSATVAVTGFQIEPPFPYGSNIFKTVEVAHGGGEFTIGPLRPGRYTLGAQAQGLGRGETKLITVQQGRTASGIRIEIAGGGTVSGTIHAEDGSPIPRARVDVFEPNSAFKVRPVTTAADGTFKVEGVPAGRRSVRVSARGFITSVAGGLDVVAGKETTTSVILSRAEQGARFQFSGIGAILQSTPQGTAVMDLMPGHPAEQFGLKKGDLILSVDGEQAADLRLDTIVEMIRGQDGVPVVLDLDRPGAGRQRLEIQRGKVIVR